MVAVLFMSLSCPSTGCTGSLTEAIPKLAREGAVFRLHSFPAPPRWRTTGRRLDVLDDLAVSPSFPRTPFRSGLILSYDGRPPGAPRPHGCDGRGDVSTRCRRPSQGEVKAWETHDRRDRL